MTKQKSYRFSKFLTLSSTVRDWDTLVVTNLDVTNPTYITLQIVHGQAIGFHCCIFVTNDEIEWSSLISIGNVFQITEPKYLTEFLTLRIEFTEGITSSDLDRKLMVLSLFTNNSFKLFPEISWKSCKFQLRVSGYFDG